MLLLLSLAKFLILLGPTHKAIAHPSIWTREDLYDAPSQAMQSEILPGFENVLDHENIQRYPLGGEHMPQQPSSLINGNGEHDQQGKQPHEQERLHWC